MFKPSVTPRCEAGHEEVVIANRALAAEKGADRLAQARPTPGKVKAVNRVVPVNGSA